MAVFFFCGWCFIVVFCKLPLAAPFQDSFGRWSPVRMPVVVPDRRGPGARARLFLSSN